MFPVWGGDSRPYLLHERNDGMEKQNQPPGNQTAQAQQIPQDEINKMNEDKAGFVTLQKIRDLLQYLYTAFVKYPKSEKLGLVADYKQNLYEFLFLIIQARKKYYKKTTLQDADVRLEMLRMLNDLSYDLHYIDIKRYELIARQLNEIGRLLGGWIKNVNK